MVILSGNTSPLAPPRHGGRSSQAAAGLTLPPAVLLLEPVLRCWAGRSRLECHFVSLICPTSRCLNEHRRWAEAVSLCAIRPSVSFPASGKSTAQCHPRSAASRKSVRSCDGAWPGGLQTKDGYWRLGRRAPGTPALRSALRPTASAPGDDSPS